MNAESNSPPVSAVEETGGVETAPADADPVALDAEINEAVSEALDVEPSVGQRLRAAREAKSMGIVDVAARLKLSPHQVEALESDDRSRLQCNTITRGFVRNYARLVGLDGSELMSALDQLAKPQAKELAVPSSINVKVPNEHGVERRDYVRVAGGFLVLTFAVLAYFFLPTEFVHSTYSAIKERLSSKPSESSEPAVLPPESARPAEGAEANPPAATTGAATEPVPPSSALAQPVATSAGAVNVAPLAPPSASDSVMKFSFSKPSWVEIKDRSGQIIFSQLSPAGSQREVSGQAPFALIVGNAANVTLHYKGKDVDLSRRSKDDVARLTLE